MDGEGINHGITYGKKCGAYPDGRLAGDQFSKNLMPVFGCDKRGILAYLNSVTKIDAEDYPNGAPIDFILHPSAVEGEDGLCVMLSLIRTIFEKGGSAAQCGIYSAELLRDAQEHPELHRGLQVRLCGWSQYFDKLTRDEQDMLIRQAEVGAR
jgi:formate C-acetyltransferase